MFSPSSLRSSLGIIRVFSPYLAALPALHARFACKFLVFDICLFLPFLIPALLFSLSFGINRRNRIQGQSMIGRLFSPPPYPHHTTANVCTCLRFNRDKALAISSFVHSRLIAPIQPMRSQQPLMLKIKSTTTWQGSNP